MKKEAQDYWMYSKYAIEVALQNPYRKVKEMLVEHKFEQVYRKLVKKNNIIKKKFKFKVTNKGEILKKIGKFAKYQGVALLVESIAINRKSFKVDKISIKFIKKLFSSLVHY